MRIVDVFFEGIFSFWKRGKLKSNRLETYDNVRLLNMLPIVTWNNVLTLEWREIMLCYALNQMRFVLELSKSHKTFVTVISSSFFSLHWNKCKSASDLFLGILCLFQNICANNFCDWNLYETQVIMQNGFLHTCDRAPRCCKHLHIFEIVVFFPVFYATCSPWL